MVQFQRRWIVNEDGNIVDLSSNAINGEPKEWRGNVDNTTEATIDVNAALGRNGVVGYIINNDTTDDLYVYVSKDGTTYNNYADFATAKADSGWITIPEGGMGYALDKHSVDTIKLLAAAGTVPYIVVML